jgi:ribosomal 50S subunit-recycling heat shock protein
MRVDQYLQRVGIVKQRSLAKLLCDNGAVQINDRKVKAAQVVNADDVIKVKFRTKSCTYRVLQVPPGNVKKESRDEFVRLTAEEFFHED